MRTRRGRTCCDVGRTTESDARLDLKAPLEVRGSISFFTLKSRLLSLLSLLSLHFKCIEMVEVAQLLSAL